MLQQQSLTQAVSSDSLQETRLSLLFLDTEDVHKLSTLLILKGLMNKINEDYQD